MPINGIEYSHQQLEVQCQGRTFNKLREITFGRQKENVTPVRTQKGEIVGSTAGINTYAATMGIFASDYEELRELVTTNPDRDISFQIFDINAAYENEDNLTFHEIRILRCRIINEEYSNGSSDGSDPITITLTLNVNDVRINGRKF